MGLFDWLTNHNEDEFGLLGLVENTLGGARETAQGLGTMGLEALSLGKADTALNGMTPGDMAGGFLDDLGHRYGPLLPGGEPAGVVPGRMYEDPFSYLLDAADVAGLGYLGYKGAKWATEPLGGGYDLVPKEKFVDLHSGPGEGLADDFRYRPEVGDADDFRRMWDEGNDLPGEVDEVFDDMTELTPYKYLMRDTDEMSNVAGVDELADLYRDYDVPDGWLGRHLEEITNISDEPLQLSGLQESWLGEQLEEMNVRETLALEHALSGVSEANPRITESRPIAPGEDLGALQNVEMQEVLDHAIGGGLDPDSALDSIMGNYAKDPWMRNKFERNPYKHMPDEVVPDVLDYLERQPPAFTGETTRSGLPKVRRLSTFEHDLREVLTDMVDPDRIVEGWNPGPNRDSAFSDNVGRVNSMFRHSDAVEEFGPDGVPVDASDVDLDWEAVFGSPKPEGVDVAWSAGLKSKAHWDPNMEKIRVHPTMSDDALPYTLRHERAHQWKDQNLGDLFAGSYDSQLGRYLEEVAAETFATKNPLIGLKHPTHPGYRLTPGGVLTDAAKVGFGAYGVGRLVEELAEILGEDVYAQ